MKKTYFICLGFNNNIIIFEDIEALTAQDAIFYFKQKFNVQPYDIKGPFFKKRNNCNRKLKNIKLSNTAYCGKYNGWNVTINELVEPINYCLINYESKIDEIDIMLSDKPDSEIIPIWKIKGSYENK